MDSDGMMNEQGTTQAMGNGVRARSTTVVAVIRNGKIALAADGQVTLGETVMKQSADKVRRVGKGRAIVGFAGGVADALTLLERLEGKFETHPGNVRRAAVELARSGYRVFGTVRKEADADALRALGVENLEPVICDVADTAAVAQAVAAVTAALAGEPLVAIVNNAGISNDLPLEIQPLASVRQVFDVNYFGVLDVTQQFLPLLRKTGPGARIVTIGSLAGTISAPGTVAYSGTKVPVCTLCTR